MSVGKAPRPARGPDDQQRRAAPCLTDSSAGSWSSAASVSGACAWTRPGAFPEADPVAVLVRYHTPNVYRAVVVWYYVAPGVAVFLAGQFLLATSRIWCTRMGVSVGLRSRLPAWRFSARSDPASVGMYASVAHRVGQRWRLHRAVPRWPADMEPAECDLARFVLARLHGRVPLESTLPS